MLKKLYLCLIFIFCLLGSICSEASESEHKISLSVMPNIKPVAFRNQKGEPDGIFVRVLQEIAKIHNFQIEYHFLPWNEGLEAVKKGEIDLQVGAIKTPEREEFLDYVDESVMTGWGHVRIHVDSDITNIFDLTDKKIGVMVSDQNYRNFKTLVDSFKIDCQYVEVDSHKKIIDMVAAKEVDAGVLFNMTQIPNSKVKNSPIVFSPAKSYFVTAKGRNAKILEIISMQLKAWKKDKSSPYYDVVNRFFGGDYVKEMIPQEVKILAVVLSFVLILLIALIYSLKYLVDMKTKDLKDSETMFRTIVENMPIMMDALDAKANVIMWNKECERVTGYASEEIIGNRDIYKYFYKDEVYRKSVVDAICAGMDDFRLQDFPITAKDGSEKVISWSSVSKAIPIEGWHFWAAGFDVTKLQETQKALELAKEEAEESDRLKTAFVASISHEIRTPMNGLLGFANLLHDIDLTDKDNAEYIQIIKDSGKRMLTIINDLIDVSKIEASQVELRLKKISVNALLDELYHNFKLKVEMKNITFECVKGLPDSESFLLMDKDCILKVLNHLLTNAIKFTDKGGIVFGYTKKEEGFEFFVKDSGIGIAADVQALIFERFRQLDDSYSKKYEGAGLGLNIAKSYVEMHGGSIGLESTKGEGSCFYFVLPEKEAENYII